MEPLPPHGGPIMARPLPLLLLCLAAAATLSLAASLGTPRQAPQMLAVATPGLATSAPASLRLVRAAPAGWVGQAAATQAGAPPARSGRPAAAGPGLEASPSPPAVWWAPLSLGFVVGVALLVQALRLRTPDSALQPLMLRSPVRGWTAAEEEGDVIAIMAYSGAGAAGGASAPPLLEVCNLEARVVATGQPILKGFSLTVREGEVHAIMGKNGSGKSTFTKVLVGHPGYEVTGGTVRYRGKDLLAMAPEERSHEGLFLSFQAPIEIPGVSNTDFLRMAYNAKRKARGEAEKDPLEFYGHLMPKLQQLKMDPSFLTRNVNEGFSGGEKKRNEILQLAVLEADLALLDEIDSGLDVDALRDVAAAVNGLKRPTSGLVMITHYKRLLDLIEPDAIHIVADGKVVQSGDKSLSSILEEEGFGAFK
eukprot:EG_transcript_13141